MDFHQQIDEVLTQVSRLTVDQAVKDDVENCLTALREMDIKILLGGVATCANNVSLDDIISMSIKFVDIISGINNVLSFLPVCWGNVFNIVSVVCGAVFTTNIDLAIRQTYGELKEEDLMEKCQVFYMRINQCISYMKGLPDARTLSQEEKTTHLQLLATDINIFMGFDEITFLGNSIKLLARKKTLADFDTLMKKVQLYCCLTTLRELFLLYRYGMQLAFNIGADSIGNVLTSQRQYDKDVLEFLWKPTYSNAHLIHNYNPNDWPITALFLEKQKLVENLFPLLEGKSFHIESVYYRNQLLKSHRRVHFEDNLDCGGPSGALSVFTLHGRDHNTFSVYGNCYLPELIHFERTRNIRLKFTSNKETPNGMWHVIKIDPDTPDGEPWYMFRLKANTKICLGASEVPFGFLLGPPTFPRWEYVKYPDKTYFWKLTQVIADDKGEYKECKAMV